MRVHGPLCVCARHWPARAARVGGRGTNPLRAGKSKMHQKVHWCFLAVERSGRVVLPRLGGFDARKCAKSCAHHKFCSQCSHCAKVCGNAGSPCLCGVLTVLTVLTAFFRMARLSRRMACTPLHLFGRLCGTAGAQGLRGRGRVKSPQPPTGHRSSSWIFMRASFEGGGIRSLTVCCVVLGLNSMPDVPPVAPAFPACAPTL